MVAVPNFSNLKSWLIGTHKFVSVKHMQNYLNEYTFRFNRRGNSKKVFNDLLTIAILLQARPYDGFVKPKKPYYVNPKNNLDSDEKDVIK